MMIGMVGPAGGKDNDKAADRAAASQQAVLLQFLAQGIAVDTQIIGSDGLIAADLFEHGFKHRFLDTGNHHVVDIAGLLIAEIAKITMQAIADAAFDMVFTHAAKGSVA
jgi:hypothetical protein